MTRPHVAKHAAITTADVKIALIPRAPAETLPVHLMLLLRMIDNDQWRFARWIRDVRIGGDEKFRNVVYACAK